MPQLGESVAEGTIGKWLKKPGDQVAKYEPLLEVITDKVNAEVPSPFAGVLKEILAEEGATVPNNAEIAIIETADEASGATAAPAGGAKVEAAAPAAAPAAGAAAARPAPAPTSPVAPPAPAVAAVSVASPAALGPARSDERRPSETPERAAASASTNGSQAPAASAPSTSPTAPTAPAAIASAPAETGESEGRMTPAVRRLLREHGLSASVIVGTGGGGRITREDVGNYVESARTGAAVNGQSAQARPNVAPAAPAGGNGAATSAPGASAPSPSAAPTAPTAPSASASAAPSASSAPSARGIEGQKVTFPDGADEVLVPMTQMRRGIAAAMTRALTIPQAYVQVEVDATRLVRIRESAKRDFQAREGTSLSFVPFVVKAVVSALTRNPAFNAHWTDQGLLARRRINMGVAVAVADGLIVPVVHDVDQLSIAGINRAIADVAERARANKLRLDDLQGSTFTIDNTGWFGSNLTLPIINPPEVAILTMEAITKRAVVLESPDGDTIAIRPIMNMVLAIDHRANDGAQAAAFLNEIKRNLEAIGPETSIY